jgi:hypothetical protein
MREDYYKFILEQGIQDTFSWIEDMPYSKKISILEEVLNLYGVEILNRALFLYEQRYVKEHRVISYMTRNILVNFCKTIQLKENK